MNRQNQIAYCASCINGSLSKEKGYICKLTQEKATFIRHCDSYEVDAETRRQRLREHRKEIARNIKENQSIRGALRSLYPKYKLLITESQKDTIKNYDLSKGIILKKTSKVFIIILSLSVFLIVTNAVSLLREISSNDFSTLLPEIAAIVIALGLVLVAKKVFKAKDFVELDERGILLNNTLFLPWLSIEFIHFEKDYIEDKPEDYLRIRTKQQLEETSIIPYKNLSMSPKELGELLYYCMKHYGFKE